MKIRMLQSRLGTEDGFTVRYFPRHAVAEVRETLACYFIAQGWAILMTE